MPRHRAPTRAEFDNLKAQFQTLLAQTAALSEQLSAVRQELRIQFQRIAEMQAVLDEERMANAVSSEHRPLIRERR